MINQVFYPNKNNVIVWLNAIFLLLLLLFDFADPLTIVFAYFLETIIIGVFHVLKLGLVIKHGKKDVKTNKNNITGFALILFFIVHYGMFVAIQSVFVFTFFENILLEIKNAFNILKNYNHIINREGMFIIIFSIIVTNLVYFYNNFWHNKKYKEYSPNNIFFKPYIRIFIQQFVVILAGFFFIVFEAGKVAAIFLIVFRLVVDLGMVFIHRDSKGFDTFVKRKSKSYNHYLEMKNKYQEFSE